MGDIAKWHFARFAENGYEVSSHGDKRFSALFARLRDGRTIEEAYQLDVKGYRAVGDNWRVGKGKPPLRDGVDLYGEYLALWRQWAADNRPLIEDLRLRAAGRVLTDKFATSPVSQARALADILNENHRMNDLSIDIEAMGLRPGSAVVAIGAVFFDTNTGELSDKFYRAIHLATAVRVGLTMDASTVLWWLSQSDEVRNAIRFSAMDITDALSEFNQWVLAQCPKNDVRPWFRGPSYDGSLLTAAYAACGIEQPWHYWSERCHRTLTARNPSVEAPEMEGEAHRADDDALRQALWLQKIAAHHRAKAAA